MRSKGQKHTADYPAGKQSAGTKMRGGRGGRVLAGAAAGSHRRIQEKKDAQQEDGSDRPSTSPIPTPATRGTPTMSPEASASPESGRKHVGTSTGKRPNILADLPKPIEDMSMEEIEALPAAKRRKGLKLRGAAGPGRGWRKGLKMDQKPVYGGKSGGPTRIASGTPASFSKPKSSLARDALSKTGTPMRSESPHSRSSPFDGDSSLQGAEDPAKRAAAIAAFKKRVGDELAVQKKKQQQSTAAAISAAQADETRAVKAIVKGAPPVLPLNKVPGSFATVAPLDKSKRPTRNWERRGREVLSIGGRPWFAASWITTEANQFPTSAELKATNSSSNAAGAGAAASGTAGATRTGTPAMATAGPSGTVTPSNGTSRMRAEAAGPPSSPPKAATPMAADKDGVDGKGGEATGAASPGRSTVGMPATNAPSPAANASLPLPNLAAAAASKAPPGTAAAGGESPVADWRGSSAAFTMANRGRH